MEYRHVRLDGRCVLHKDSWWRWWMLWVTRAAAHCLPTPFDTPTGNFPAKQVRPNSVFFFQKRKRIVQTVRTPKYIIKLQNYTILQKTTSKHTWRYVIISDVNVTLASQQITFLAYENKHRHTGLFLPQDCLRNAWRAPGKCFRQ
jgi:hypothetical protein